MANSSKSLRSVADWLAERYLGGRGFESLKGVRDSISLVARSRRAEYSLFHW